MKKLHHFSKTFTASLLCGTIAMTGVLPARASVNQTMADLVDRIAAESEENVIISPFSIRVALSMLAEGANGETKEQLDAFLEKYAGELELEDGTELYSANSFWLDQLFSPKDAYVALLKEKYDALVETIDFTKEGAADIMNQWISENTKGLIDGLVSDDSIAGADAVLLNALYYNGIWQNPFEEYEIEEKDFHSVKGDQTATMLFGYDDGWNYFENDQAAGFRIFYEDGLQFIAFLPNEEDFQLADIDLDALLESNNEWCTKNVSLHYELPEFKSEYEVSLKDALGAAGLDSMFSGSADLSGIHDVMKVDDVLHKTYIDVNRKGTEAAAVTGIIMEAMAMPSMETEEIIYKEVILDRPFGFMILEPMSGEILFMGKVNSVES